MKHSKIPGILALVLLGGCLGGIFFVAASDSILIDRIVGTAGNPITTLGTFDPRGNAGLVDMTTEPTSFSGVHIVGSFDTDAGTTSNYLTGYFHLQTVGWATFSDVGQGVVTLIPPSGPTASIRDPWTLSGYAWNEKIGWIRLNPDNTNWTASTSPGVQYLPDTRVLTGFAWSEMLGWVPFSSTSVVTGLTEGLIGRVRIIGNTAANNTYDVLYGVTGRVGATSTLASMVDLVRKNIAILFRNAGAYKNTDFPLTTVNTPKVLNKTIYYSFANNASQDTVVKYSYLKTALASQQALVVEGVSIYIDEDVIQDQGEPRVLVALPNEKGIGGNIIIDPRVKNIKISLIAEGSLLSGIQKADGTIYLYNDRKDKIAFGLPKVQLAIKGNVNTYNTIGGSAKDGVQKCPVVEKNCDRDSALKYDLNYFRTYDKNPLNRAISNNEDYSIIIEQDPRVISRPPLILEKR